MSAGAGAAAAGAAAARRRIQQEEEEMTDYGPQELADGWEFKILRSMTGAFKHPDKLQHILSEERRAGWILVEKFDNGRIRLKRPASAREMDGKLDFDPYRTYVGPSENKFGLIVMGVVFGIVAVIFGLIAIIVNSQ